MAPNEIYYKPANYNVVKNGDTNSHSDWSHSGSTSSMRYTEGLMEIEMGDITTIIPQPTQTNLSVHVCTIEVDLPSTIMYHGTDLSIMG